MGSDLRLALGFVILLGRLFLLRKGGAISRLAGPFGLALVLVGRSLAHLGRPWLVEVGLRRAGRFGFGRVPAAGGGLAEIVGAQAGRAVAGLAIGAFRTRCVGIEALNGTGRTALAGRRAGAAFAGAIDGRNGNATLTGAVLFDRLGEGIGLGGSDFEDGFGVEDADRTDGRLGDAAGLAQHGQEPTRLGLVLAADRDLEPGTALEALAGAWVLVAGLIGHHGGADILGRRPRGELLAQIGSGDGFDGMTLHELGDEFGFFLGDWLAEHLVGEDAL